MQRVDEEIIKSEQDSGKTSSQREDIIPHEPLKSVGTRVPKGLPIGFYNPSWFNSRSAGQKKITADAFNVAFLPNASQSLRGAQHPYKRLGDRKFTNKYWDQLIKPYDISHEIPNEEELYETDEETYDYSEIESSENESDEEEEVQEVAELNQLCDKDTPMAEALEADYFNTGSSHLAFENKWSGW
ncbi:hypothetical protein O181_010412 [Austropuccinia psidii MF-1]|uniref:Uncharacterized protein n=1 Tax=Austropuccinia psidii MF-1 TaxID=1389203 RepID=A0A9Q3GL66_9BASI|nr:hypothetical protein [Austropuccinia psidii MF-1]